MPNAEPDRRLLVLSPDDNVAVACQDLAAGTAVTLGRDGVALQGDIELGHKVACRAISKGEKIVKYGAPVGSATDDIKAGEHVHLHNMKSDYIVFEGHTKDEEVRT